MKCCQRHRKKRVKGVKRYRKNSIYPSEIVNSPTSTSRLTAKEYNHFVKEVIYCGGCKTPFNIGSNELKIHCNHCNQFFHCKIAGKCYGKDCMIKTENGEIHRASYCYGCVGKITDKGCLCKDCYSK